VQEGLTSSIGSRPARKQRTAATAAAGHAARVESARKARLAKSRSKRASDKTLPLHAKLTNGRKVFAIGDGRSAWTVRFKRLFASHTESLGGAANLSTAKLSLIRRVAAIETQLEQLESLMASSVCEMPELDLYNRLSGNLRRLLETLGLERQARDVTQKNPLSEHFSRRKTKSPFADVIDAVAND
jgi:hypothetical protein